MSRDSTSTELRMCALTGCKKRISILKPPQTKYCTDKHAKKAARDRYDAKKKAERQAQAKFDQPMSSERVRFGETYRTLKNDHSTVARLLAGTETQTAVAARYDVTVGAITRSMHAIKSDLEFEKLQQDWRQSWKARTMLPVQALTELREMDPETAEFEQTLDHLIRAYAMFSRYYFTLEGRRPIVKPFHLKWIRATIRAYAIGGKQLILSPPRHGKSEMLVRFVVWLIVMDPNIRIGWFCAGTDVAKLMLGAVKDHLTNNTRLIEDTLPPGDSYVPEHNSGKPWSAKEIKVRQQSHVGQKSSSLLALGRTSKFLSRDMDLIVIDDMEDFDSTRELSQRVYSRNKLAEIGTRKEEHTAELYIGSRQHPDDIPNHILSLEGSLLQWDIIVDSAHDEDCPHDPDEFELHTDCMLFPEVRSYRWLMEKKLEMETLGIPHAYPMRYLNRPIPPEGQIFDVELIRDVALNRERGLGLEGLPLGYLVGGLDPSARGMQAAWVWHYRRDEESKNGVKMSMVDADTEKAGGQDGAVRIIVRWYEEYGVQLWFYESNAQQADFYKKVKERVQKIYPEIVIKDHNTGANKKDPELGISAMAPLYHNGDVDLPYGTGEARRKVNMLLRQLELWTSDGVANRKHLTDIKMAQWFPWAGKIQKFVKQHRRVRQVKQSNASYQEVGSFDNVPWNQTEYPGGF